MTDMMTTDNRPPPGGRIDRGAAWGLAALAGILVITAGWWALALWPLPEETPEWLVRARAACFGRTISGLPNGGGWMLLVGQPLGMLIVLFAVWGGAVTRGLEALRVRRFGQVVLAATALMLLAGSVGAVNRVATATGDRFDLRGGDRAAPLVEENRDAPEFGLVNQHGERVTIAQFRGEPLLVTFAFGHCATICPLIVKDMLAARRELGVEIPAVVVTLDPWRDTPSRLPTIATAWQLPEGVHVLSGTVQEVEFALDRWKIPRVRNQSTGDIVHPAVTYIVAPNGRLAYWSDGSTERVVQGARRVGGQWGQ